MEQIATSVLLSARLRFLRCLPFQRAIRGGRLFYDGCYLRYDDYDFFNETLSAQDKTICATGDFSGGNKTVFSANVLDLVKNLSVQAPKNDGFFVGSVDRGNVSVFGLAQCWEFVNGTACETCLTNAASKIGMCAPKDEGRVLNAGCYLRYSTQKFYDNSTIPSRKNKRHGRLTVILAVTLPCVAVASIIATAVFFARRRVVEKKRARKELGALLGTLSDGTTVAIKRLLFNTRQWVDHFFNEVNLISGIQHKNLAKLLGCSVTGPESLLVYEYVPNQSLHDYFSAKTNLPPLSWEMRLFLYVIFIGEVT
ncbi:CYSTEINE-RICH RECEPTOR-LIKE PROTEIN KINASE 3 [Salix viminalis]|uniref:CYSTEINE-RICH RECEPTOR-LIKE PROTEIN KINASE 3 n=1 Tax=Salix viminalis TaxID=40686 RepID=A0A9Q0U1Z6_SALVM|nr:CYSTEINE-RICH RECEPTOR-LIKE PROTEIN KINASE 3 [Salix viminalis]